MGDLLKTVSALLLTTWIVQSHATGTERDAVKMKVYKSETCGCCIHWMNHLETNNFATTAYHPRDLGGLKGALGISPAMQSCHTGMVDDQYVFEGHVPAKHIKAFLANPPKGAIGLSVPGMPVGSPGMEVGERFDPYTVVQINADGSTTPFARIAEPDDQY
jgi:hypothetical protein